MIIRFVLVVVFFVIGFVAFLTNPVKVDRASPWPVPAEASRLRAHVEALTSIEPRRDAANGPSLERAADYVASEFRTLGFEPEFQTWDFEGRTYKNVSVLIGRPGPARLVISAHYDSEANTPGADDNASGVAGMLELARLAAADRDRLPRPVQFVAYSLEETGLMGSSVHARSLRSSGTAVRLMLSLEMIGYFRDEPDSQNYPLPVLNKLYPTTGNFIAVIGRTGDWSDVRRVKTSIQRHADIAVHSINAPPGVIPGLALSDHASFWREDFRALMITDTAYLRNPNYHQPGDTADTLDYIRMAEVVNGVYGVIADGELP